MNIAIATTEFVSETNFDGGLANYTYKLAKWLLNNGHNATVFLTAQKSEKINFDGITVVKVAIPDLRWQYKYKFERFKLGFLMNKKKYDKLEFEANARYINKSIEEENKNQRFDIVHYPHISGLALYCPESLPGIVRLSSSTKLCQQFGGYGYSDLSIEMQEEIEIEAMKKIDKVFGPSKMITSLTEKVINKKIEVIETPYIKPSQSFDTSLYEQKLKSKKYVLFFGSIGLVKGVGTIAEIIFDLFEKNKDLHFVFVGKKVNNQINNTPLWDHLIQKAGKHANRIIHFEALKHDKLFPIIQNAQCVVLPSLIDNFPNTCIEAMANSKIVIGTVGNGFDQLIDSGKNGFLIDPNDHNQLFKKINKVLDLPPAERERIELAAKKRIDKLDPDIVLKQLVELYRTTIKNFKN